MGEWRFSGPSIQCKSNSIFIFNELSQTHEPKQSRPRPYIWWHCMNKRDENKTNSCWYWSSGLISLARIYSISCKQNWRGGCFTHNVYTRVLQEVIDQQITSLHIICSHCQLKPNREKKGASFIRLAIVVVSFFNIGKSFTGIRFSKLTANVESNSL